MEDVFHQANNKKNLDKSKIVIEIIRYGSQKLKDHILLYLLE